MESSTETKRPPDPCAINNTLMRGQIVSRQIYTCVHQQKINSVDCKVGSNWSVERLCIILADILIVVNSFKPDFPPKFWYFKSTHAPITEWQQIALAISDDNMSLNMSVNIPYKVKMSLLSLGSKEIIKKDGKSPEVNNSKQWVYNEVNVCNVQVNIDHTSLMALFDWLPDWRSYVGSLEIKKCPIF